MSPSLPTFAKNAKVGHPSAGMKQQHGESFVGVH
jgi:hypothetical protein